MLVSPLDISLECHPTKALKAAKIPAHNIPAFKPAKVFVEGVKTKTGVAV